MSERERLNETLRTGTLVLVFLLVSIQFALFLLKAVPEFRNRCSDIASAETDVEDTLAAGNAIVSEASGNGEERVARRQSADAGRFVAEVAEVPLPTRNAGENSHSAEALEPKGDSGWKWDVVELNCADSAELVSLPGIGAYYAKCILKYREKLGSFISTDQLLEIRGIDSVKYERLKSRVRVDVSSVRWIDLNCDSIAVLAAHPYIGGYAAKGIERLRRVSGGQVSLDDIVKNGILTDEAAARLSRYLRKAN